MENLIHHKKQLFYILSNADQTIMLKSEKKLLDILKEDIELQAELNYDYYIKGE